MAYVFTPVVEPLPASLIELRRMLRYLVVLSVWAGLFVIRPRLALKILAERRADSPLPRVWRRSL